MQPESGFELMKRVLEREGERLKLELADIPWQVRACGQQGRVGGADIQGVSQQIPPSSQ